MQGPVFKQIPQVPPIVYLKKHVTDILHYVPVLAGKLSIKNSKAPLAVLYVHLPEVLIGEQMHFIKLQAHTVRCQRRVGATGKEDAAFGSIRHDKYLKDER